MEKEIIIDNVETEISRSLPDGDGGDKPEANGSDNEVNAVTRFNDSSVEEYLTANFDLEYSEHIAKETNHLFDRVKRVIPEIEWPAFAPYIYHINKLKKAKNAVILAHNYMTPEIFHCVSDFKGDSLELAIKSAETDGDIIVQCGVYFMAETSKLLNPDRVVLIPDSEAGCSLSESITGADVRELRKKYPGVPVVSYVNTSADVKAETDICCTSSNIDKVVNSLDVEQVLCIPDQYLTENTKAKTKVELIKWPGSCIVHEQFSKQDIAEMREAHPGIKVIAHPECKPEIIEVSDYSGSTKGMITWVKDNQPEKVMMVTECSMSDNVAVSNPNVDFVRPCNLCPFMKKITLPKILYSLDRGVHEVKIDKDIAAKARLSVERMINLNN